LAVIFFLLHVGCPLWWEDWSVICSAVIHWLELCRTHNHILLSHLRLPQPGGPDPLIYIPQEQGGLVIPPGTGFPFCYLVGLLIMKYHHILTWNLTDIFLMFRTTSLYNVC
jgi:hypothetical protein